MFPSILIARKPTNIPTPVAARVCAIPREQLRVDDLSRQIKSEGYDVPRDRLGSAPWNLEPLGVTKLLEKMREKGAPLKKFVGTTPCRGILTGFNEAYLIDTATKDTLVRADPKSASLFKKYLRGQDIDRWQAEWNGLWMLALKSSGNHTWPWSEATENAEAVFAATYPAIYTHLNIQRDSVVKRQDQGEHWWELRACAYWHQFEKPKIMYQEIQYHSCYMFDTNGMLANNKVFFVPTSDLYLLGILNSSLMWWHNWRFLPHMKDEALSPVGFMMESLPIVEPSDETRIGVVTAVGRLLDITEKQQRERRAILDWLRVEFEIDKPSQKLQDVGRLDTDTLTSEVKKARGRSKPLSVAQVRRLKEEHAGTIVPLQTLAGEALALEGRVSDLVNAAYGLTPEEVALMWQTAPPRMPLEGPNKRP